MKYYLSKIIQHTGDKYHHDNPYPEYSIIHENTFDTPASNIELESTNRKSIQNLNIKDLIRVEDFVCFSDELIEENIIAVCVCDGHGSMIVSDNIVFGAYECSKWMTIHMLSYLEFYHEFICSLKKQSYLQLNTIIEQAFEFAQAQYIEYLEFYVKSNDYFQNKNSEMSSHESIKHYAKKKLENIQFNHKKIDLFQFPKNKIDTFPLDAEFPKIFKSDYHPKLRFESKEGKVKYSFNIPVFSYNGQNFSVQSGCTCSLLLCVQNYIFCGNVGDSDCYLIDSNCNMFPLFQKHDTSCEKEIERLEGLCVPQKSYFSIKFKKLFDERYLSSTNHDAVPVKGKRLQPSRNLGHPIVRHAGITHKPTIKYIESNVGDILIIGSDGLWNYLDSDEVCDLLKINPVPKSIVSGQEKVNYVANLIYQKYMLVWKIKSKKYDNMTFAVVMCCVN